MGALGWGPEFNTKLKQLGWHMKTQDTGSLGPQPSWPLLCFGSIHWAHERAEYCGLESRALSCYDQSCGHHQTARTESTAKSVILTSRQSAPGLSLPWFGNSIDSHLWFGANFEGDKLQRRISDFLLLRTDELEQLTGKKRGWDVITVVFQEWAKMSPSNIQQQWGRWLVRCNVGEEGGAWENSHPTQAVSGGTPVSGVGRRQCEASRKEHESSLGPRKTHSVYIRGPPWPQLVPIFHCKGCRDT